MKEHFTEKYSLYTILGLSKEASEDEIKKAYRRKALAHHPDKTGRADDDTFLKISFAYDHLKDDEKKKIYDETGEIETAQTKTPEEWAAYYKDLFKDQVTKSKLEEFKQEYQDSAEEKKDIKEAYSASHGNLEHLMGLVMCAEIEDEPRIIKIVEKLIKKKELTEYLDEWRKSSTDTNAKKQRLKNAKREAKEAEAYAKELGVYDDLFGAKKETTKSKPSGKSKRKSDAADDDEETLRNLIQSRQKGRMESLISSLESKYGNPDKPKSKKSKKSKKSE